MSKHLMELSRAEVVTLVISELHKRHPGALPFSIDFEPRTDGGFCHCWWLPPVSKSKNPLDDGGKA